MTNTLEQIESFIATCKDNSAIRACNDTIKKYRYSYGTLSNSKTTKLGDIYYYLGKAHLRQGKYSESIRNLTIALNYNPEHAAAMTEKGLALHKAGRTDEGLWCCDTAYNKLNPSNASAYVTKALILMCNGQYQEAGNLLECYYHKKSELEVTALSELREGYISKLKNNRQSELKYNLNAIKLYDLCLEAWWNIARIYSSLNCHVEAIKAYEKILKLNQDFGNSLVEQLFDQYFYLLANNEPSQYYLEFEKYNLNSPGKEYNGKQNYLDLAWSLFYKALNYTTADGGARNRILREALDYFAIAEKVSEIKRLAIAGKVKCYDLLEDGQNLRIQKSRLEDYLKSLSTIDESYKVFS